MNLYSYILEQTYHFGFQVSQQFQFPSPADIISDAVRANEYFLAHEDEKSFSDHSWEKGTYMVSVYMQQYCCYS